MSTIDDVKDYIRQVMAGFTDDPADNNFQTGFMVAFLDLATELGIDNEQVVLDCAEANGYKRKPNQPNGQFLRSGITND